MTDSNLKLNEQNSINEENSTSNVELTELEPVVNNNSQTEGFVNFDANIDTENIINSFYINDNEFDFYKDDTFDPSKAAFNSLNIDFTPPTEQSDVIPVSDGMLKYLGFVNLFEGIGGNLRTPIRTRSDVQQINKLLKQQTGYTYNQFKNNDIPKDVIETPEFQKGLDNMYNFYQDKGFNVEIPERTNLTQFNQTLKGLGIEIGGGISLDYATAPLLNAGGWGKLAYGAINFIGGGYLNYLSQEARLGQTGFLGQKDKLSWGELFGAGGTQTIPFGVTDKGFKGVSKSFAFGGTLGASETTVRNLIDEKEFPTFKEYLLSIGLGGTFAATFKGGLELFDGLLTKFKGKSPKEISNLITDKEVKKLNQFVDDSLTLQNQLQQQPQAKGNKNNQNLGDSNFPDTRGKNKFYHGSSKEIPDGKVTSVESGDNIVDNNLYGNGFYTTEDLTTASKYQKKGKKQVLKPEIPIAKGIKRESDLPYGIQSDLKKLNITDVELNQLVTPGTEIPSAERLRDLANQARQFPIDNPFSDGGRTNVEAYNKIANRLDELATNPPKTPEFKPVVYEITEKQPVKFIDADQKLNWTDDTPEVQLIKEILEGTDEGGEVLDVWETTKSFSYADIVENLKDIYQREALSVGEFTNLLDDLNFELSKIGYGGVTHQGGNLAGKGKRLHKVKIYWDAENQIDIKKVDINQFKTNTSNQKQDLGDPELTPNQYTNKVAKSENFGLIEELIRLKKIKNEGGTSPIKTQYQMQLGGLNLFDDGIIDLSKTKHIQEITKIYALINDIAPTEDLAVALTQTVALATDGVVDANIKYVNALNSKDFNQIEKAINDLDLAFNEVNKWLGLSLPGRTTFGRTGQALQIEAPSGIAGKSVDEVMNMSAAEKRIAAESVGETTISLDKKITAISDLKTELNKALEKAKKTGDFTGLYKVANKIKQTNGKVEKIVALEKHQILPSIANKTARVINEIGINALMSAPGTNEVNLISGILNTYLNAFKLALGARDKDGAEAALRHFMALHQNFMFASKSWKRSWDMEDNFINMGNSKVAFNPEDRFQISTTNKDWASRIAFNWTGKGIRLPSRLMTSNDALIQAPNLIAYSTMKFFLHGKNKLGYKGDKLNTYINDSTNTIIEYFLSNGKGEIEDKVIERILGEAQEFSKSITFTNDIRTDSLFGMGANQVDKWAKNPIARLYLTFVRTPSNLISDGFKITPGIGTPLPTNTDNKLLNLAGEIVNFATLNKFLADEVRVDLLSKDPLIVQRARGGMNLAQGFGLTIAGMSFYYGNKFLEEDYVPDTILTGGGPDWTTKEGKAMWINMSKNGWQPYSVGKLQYNEDKSPKFKNGEPVYTYSSYDNSGFDPVAQVVGMMVDFVNSNGFIKGKPFDDFTVGWTGVVGRNIFNKSYTKQVNEMLEFIASAPGLVDETGDNPLKNYKLDKSKQFLADQTVSRLLPYSNLLSRFKTIPGDILEILGGYSREEMLNDENLSRFIQKRDSKVRPGDVINEDVPIEDESFNDKQLLKELWAYLKIAIHKKTPGYDANLPFMREHITNEPIVHPYKKGPDLFALRKHKTSKNYKIYLALTQIGRQLPEPKDVISAGYSNNDIEGKKLNTTEYGQLREYINTHIPQGKRYGEVNILQAMNNYLNSKPYKAASKIIEQEGLTSEKGDMLAKQIYSNLYSINNYYIKSGEAEFFTQVMGEKEIQKRLEKKGKIKLELNNQIEKELSY